MKANKNIQPSNEGYPSVHFLSRTTHKVASTVCTQSLAFEPSEGLEDEEKKLFKSKSDRTYCVHIVSWFHIFLYSRQTSIVNHGNKWWLVPFGFLSVHGEKKLETGEVRAPGCHQQRTSSEGGRKT